MSRDDRVVFVALLLDAFLLALIELFYLPIWLGGVPFPITTALAAVTTPLLVRVAGRLSPSRGAALAPFAVWFLTVFGVGLFGPGGDIVLPGIDWRTLLLIGAGSIPAAITLGQVIGRNDAARGAGRGTRTSGSLP